MNLRQVAVQLLIILNFITAVHAADFQQVQLKGPKNASEQFSGIIYGPIESSDTLWQISQRYRRNNALSIYQVMQAIYELNPGAFEQQNINLLKNGSILKLPSERYITGVSSQQAEEKAKRDSQNFQNNAAGLPAVTNSQSESSQKQVAANAATLDQTKELIEQKLGAIDEAQNRQFMAIRKQFSESISSVQSILDENKKLFERLGKVNTDIDEMRSEEQQKSLQMNQMGESIDELLEKSRQDDAEKTARLAEQDTSWLDNPITLILLFTLPVLLVLAAFAYWMVKREEPKVVKPEEYDDDLADLSLDPIATDMDDLSDALSAELSGEDHDYLDDDSLLNDVLADELEESLEDLPEEKFEAGAEVVEQDDLDSLFDEDDDDLLAEVDEDISADVSEDLADDLLAEVQGVEDKSEPDNVSIEEGESLADDDEQPEISIDELLNISVDEAIKNAPADYSEDINEEVLTNLDREISSQNEELDSVTGSLIDELEQVEEMRSMILDDDDDDDELSEPENPQLGIQKLDDLAEEINDDLLTGDFSKKDIDDANEIDISEVLKGTLQPEPADEAEELVDSEQIVEAEEFDEPEPVADEAEELGEPEPTSDEAEELDEPEPASDEAEDLEEPEPAADAAEDLEEPEPAADEAEELGEPEPTSDEAEDLEESEPAADEAGELGEPEPAVDEAEELGEPVADEAEEFGEPEPAADEAEELGEPEPASDEAEELGEPEPTSDEAEDLEEPEPATDEAEEFGEPEPASDEAEELDEPEPTSDEAEELGEPEPTSDAAEELDDPEPATDEAEEFDEPEPASDEAEELDEPEPASDAAEELDDPEPATDEAEEFDEPEPASDEAEELDELEPATDEAEELGEPEPASYEAEEFDEPEPTSDEAEELDEPEHEADEAEELGESEPAYDEAEELDEPEPAADEAEELGEPEPEFEVPNRSDSTLDEDQLEKALEDFENEELDEVLEDLTSNKTASISSLDDLEFSADDFITKDQATQPFYSPTPSTNIDNLGSIEDFDDSELDRALDETIDEASFDLSQNRSDELADLPGLGDWLDEDEDKPDDQQISDNADNADKDALEELEGSSFDEMLESIDLDNDISLAEEDDTGFDIAALLDEKIKSEPIDADEQDSEDFLDVEALLNESVSAESDDDVDRSIDLDIPLEPFVNGQDNIEMIDVDGDDGLGAKLDLAHAYIEIGEEESAKELLDEILRGGSEKQIAEAKTILNKMD
jgi:pilus assembly protein FimV